MKIRNASEKDILYLKNIRKSLTKEMIIDRIKKQISGEADFLVIENKSLIVGFVFLKYKGKSTHPDYLDIEDLFIRDSQRGKGYGTLLVKECEKRSKKRGFKKIGLAVNPSDLCLAKQLYKKLGYVHDGKDRYIDGIYNGVKDWVIDMEKSLV